MSKTAGKSPDKKRPAGSRRQQQKAETRALIKSTASRLFKERGFESTTVREVAAEAGVGLGTIFAHFPDKESLLVSTVIEDLERVQKRSWEKMPGDASMIDKMLHLAREGFAYWSKRPALSRVILREMYFRPGPARDRLRALDERSLVKLVDFLQQAVNRGELKKGTDPVLLTRITFSFYLSVLLIDPESAAGDPEPSRSTRRAKPPGMDIDAMVEQARQFLELLFNGIGTKKPVKAKSTVRGSKKGG